jgi:hypothetical protein
VRPILFLTILAVGCGQDSAPADPWLLETVDAARGFSVVTPIFPVAAGQEIQDCYFFKVPDLAAGTDIWIDRAKLALNTGSHHMNIFRVKTIVDLDPAQGNPIALGSVSGTVIHGADNKECWKSSNWADWALIANSQQSGATQRVVDWKLPTGVAERFSPGEMLMLQIHYVNSTDQTTPEDGRGGVNFYRSTRADNIALGTLFATQKKIRICRSSPAVSYSGRCALPDNSRTIVAANGHFHSRGTMFRMWSWDGKSESQPPDTAKFYENTNWEEPKMAIDLEVVLPASGGVWWTCDYHWSEPSAGCQAVDERDPQHANDCCYTFGPTVESSEHCNAFVYYYPKADSATCN